MKTSNLVQMFVFFMGGTHKSGLFQTDVLNVSLELVQIYIFIQGSVNVLTC